MKNKILKQRVNIQCKCRTQVSREKDRVKYGTCKCDSYSLNYTLPRVIANSLFQYLHDASNHIKIDPEEYDQIEKHAFSIKEYAECDPWDIASAEVSVRMEYEIKTKNWREAMFWLSENMKGLWW